MKKIITTICMVLLLLLVSCDSSSGPVVSTDSSVTSPVSERIKVEKDLLTVTLTLPASFFEDVSKLDAKAYTKQNGYIKTTVNQDGSVSIKMSKSKYKDLLETTKASIDQTLNAMVGSEQTPYIQSITYGEDYQTVTVDVDQDAYNKAGADTAPYSIGMLANMYQQYTEADLDCEIIIRDAKTGQTLFSIHYPVA